MKGLNFIMVYKVHVIALFLHFSMKGLNFIMVYKVHVRYLMELFSEVKGMD